MLRTKENTQLKMSQHMGWRIYGSSQWQSTLISEHKTHRMGSVSRDQNEKPFVGRNVL